MRANERNAVECVISRLRAPYRVEAGAFSKGCRCRAASHGQFGLAKSPSASKTSRRHESATPSALELDGAIHASLKDISASAIECFQLPEKRLPCSS
jgi:hypothetical protein